MPGTAGSKYGIINDGVPVTKSKVVEKLPKLDIKPCHSCGSSGKLGRSRHLYYYISCTNKACPMLMTTPYFYTEEEAFDSWNKRP